MKWKKKVLKTASALHYDVKYDADTLESRGRYRFQAVGIRARTCKHTHTAEKCFNPVTRGGGFKQKVSQNITGVSIWDFDWMYHCGFVISADRSLLRKNFLSQHSHHHHTCLLNALMSRQLRLLWATKKMQSDISVKSGENNCCPLNVRG